MEHLESFPIWDAQYVSPFGDALQKRIGLVRPALYNPRVKCGEELDKYAARTVGDPDLTKSKLSATAGIDGENSILRTYADPEKTLQIFVGSSDKANCKVY
ncbi:MULTISPECIES: hypothetical protein [unclassified Bradyrhizobium]|uniref:hypothetical protein n=1 Tax=unclassified Bradyrhizobium TaxID=2631580 RepID=UPI0028E97F6C|nr:MULTISPECIES: hypothetical protein [unclassified Bradyrhizobium]